MSYTGGNCEKRHYEQSIYGYIKLVPAMFSGTDSHESLFLKLADFGKCSIMKFSSASGTPKGMRLIRLNGGSMPCPISETKRTGGSKEDISVNTFLSYVHEDTY